MTLNWVAGGFLSLWRRRGYFLQPPRLHKLIPIDVSDMLDVNRTEEQWWMVFNIIGATFCVAFVALISCMFLGLLTLDELDLQIKTRAAIDADERRYAAALLPVVTQHHRLLVTLLLLNAIAYEALPLFLDKLIPSWAAILLSVSFLLIFGEVIPSAVFTGPNQLRLAARLVPLVNLCIISLWPIATPIVLLLDCLVPHDDSDDLYHRGELSALIRIQHEEREAKKARVRGSCGIGNQRNSTKSNEWRSFKKEIMEAVQERQRSRSSSFADETDVTVQMEPPPLDHTEVRVVEGALNMKTKVAMDVCTNLHNIYSVSCDIILNKKSITEIYGQGYSRVPVYKPDPNYPDSRNTIIGVLMTRQLIVIDWDHEREISSLPLQVPPCVSPRMNLVELLKLLQRGGSLMAFVCAQPGVASKAMNQGDPIPGEAGFMGLVTLEDVLESVLQETIIDEEDQTDRNLASATLTHWAAQKIQESFRLRKRSKQQVGKRASRVNADNSGISDTETTSLLESGEIGRHYA